MRTSRLPGSPPGSATRAGRHGGRRSTEAVRFNASIASDLLDLSGEMHEAIAKGSEDELERQPASRRPKPLSTTCGDVALTIYCRTPHCPFRESAITLKHSQTVLLLQDEPRRLLLELTYLASSELENVSWTWVDPANIPATELTALRADAERLRGKRLASAATERRKIGRNDPCPLEATTNTSAAALAVRFGTARSATRHRRASRARPGPCRRRACRAPSGTVARRP